MEIIKEPVEKYLTDNNRDLYNKLKLLVVNMPPMAGGAARQIFTGEQLGSTDIDFWPPLDGEPKFIDKIEDRSIVWKYYNTKNAHSYYFLPLYSSGGRNRVNTNNFTIPHIAN